MAELIRERGAGPATVVAHSWSGGVAVLLAARHPDLVRSLVLVGAACTPDSVNALDRLARRPVVGDALTVAGLAGIGGVLPRVRAGLVAARRRRGGRHGDAGVGPVDRALGYLVATLPDGGARAGGHGALGRTAGPS